ncbi:flagellin [Rhizobium sp. RU36D]|uniref:flagellin N-terminal helical domain-containing protein n=1 Tax=Rhizobium sp. RU36D TaxID=1907415 RepID=UPI0009D823F3|nr:flagellin [Rhizobium sp. RU36D]SMD20285.1 flagellin [Rhizobium sp. RU36D]
MLSIVTNGAAKSALDILRSTINSRGDAQMRVITGYRVAEAADDAAYWSIATTMRSDSKAIASVEDALGMAAAVVDTASNGIENAVDVLHKIVERLVVAKEPGADLKKVNTEVAALKDELKTIARSSNFSGENWLWRQSAADDAQRRLVGAFARTGDGRVEVSDLTYNVAGTPGSTNVNFLIDDANSEGGILTGSGFATSLGTSKNWVLFNGENSQINDEITLTQTTTTAEVAEMIKVVDAMAERATVVSTVIGALSERVQMQHEFAKDLQASLAFGVGRMVDADMNEESSRLKALKVSEALGIEALAVANANGTVIMDLLR